MAAELRKQGGVFLDAGKLALHAALEIGGVDLFRRAQELSAAQATDLLLMKQDEPTGKQAYESLRREVDSQISSDYEDIPADMADPQDDLKLWGQDYRQGPDNDALLRGLELGNDAAWVQEDLRELMALPDDGPKGMPPIHQAAKGQTRSALRRMDQMKRRHQPNHARARIGAQGQT